MARQARQGTPPPPPPPLSCDDPLALNYGDSAECVFAEPSDDTLSGTTTNTHGGNGGCNGGCNGGVQNGSTGFMGMKRSTWIWIIVGAIAAYYFCKKR
jgi:hypothetical protein